MIRVLQITGLSRGGLETFVMNIYRAMDLTNIQFDFLVMDEGVNDYENEILSLGGRIFKMPARHKGIINYYKCVNEFFKKNGSNYNAVHFHTPSLTNLFIMYYAKKYGIPIRIIHSHSSSMISSLDKVIIHHLMKLFVSDWCNYYWGCSDKALDWFYKGTRVRKKSIIINNGIDTPLFKYNIDLRKTIKRNWGLENITIIGHVGRFVTVKNHKFLIDIFYEYHKLNSQSKLLLIGDGELMGDIQKHVEILNLEDDVLFLGVREDIHNLLNIMDIFVMPSLYEGLPVSLVEAQTSGLPILASDTISKDAKMTSSFFYLSINKSAEIWANNINSIIKNHIRKDQSQLIKDKGFDIKLTAQKLYNVYTRKAYESTCVRR